MTFSGPYTGTWEESDIYVNCTNIFSTQNFIQNVKEVFTDLSLHVTNMVRTSTKDGWRKENIPNQLTPKKT